MDQDADHASVYVNLRERNAKSPRTKVGARREERETSRTLLEECS
jgi:hypothetical protein